MIYRQRFVLHLPFQSVHIHGAILFLFGLVQNYSLKDLLAQLAVSFLPIFVLAVKIVLEQRKTLKSSYELKGSIDNVLERRACRP